MTATQNDKWRVSQSEVGGNLRALEIHLDPNTLNAVNVICDPPRKIKCPFEGIGVEEYSYAADRTLDLWCL